MIEVKTEVVRHSTICLSGEDARLLRILVGNLQSRGGARYLQYETSYGVSPDVMREFLDRVYKSIGDEVKP